MMATSVFISGGPQCIHFWRHPVHTFLEYSSALIYGGTQCIDLEAHRAKHFDTTDKTIDKCTRTEEANFIKHLFN